ncbi:autotransporter outer membrane beta-barrel domain-containing protein [Sphingomonas sp. IC-11]|uniref:autotransporter outer membrane beta-barrel domain-containing protein n=1 Tax=Sphingomonas sp. IC-11 TaxID=2898528 RepID=UPI001E367A51|nr:autotransporter outer membrane beta-barrel domain-containing protein [Sphingomonas sp. IC-11]MCD2316611.1 autotransporter outer membrane beta-barrel domain-containing protein [Sphingomonas sp. IC-11]
MAGIIAPRGRRMGRYGLSASAITLAVVLAGPATAQCTPDPTISGGTINCTGSDADGLTVVTDNTTVIVARGASVQPRAAAAAITTLGQGNTLRVAGLVDGGAAKAGVFVTTGDPRTVPCDPYAGASPIYCVPGSTQTIYPSSRAAIDVVAGGTISGAQGILVRRSPANTVGFVSATITNAGTIAGTAGEAILADQTGFGGLSVYNRAGGRITGGIAGTVSYVDNAGTIDGVGRAAIASTQAGLNIVNTGSIVSSGTPATVSGGGFVTISNAAGATIGGSATAIRTTGTLNLTNAGTINGSVVSTAPSGQGSTIDTRSGTINGSLTLGAGDDTLRARFDAASGRVSSITGAIDGGAGTDTLAIGIDADTTITRTVLPTNFELLGLDLSNNATATLATGFTTGNGVALSGSGTVVNNTALVTGGPAVTTSFGSGGFGLTFDNRGTITATFANAGPATTGQFAVGSPDTVTNSGTITSLGGPGVRAFRQLTNSGSITASGTAASVDSFGAFVNSGTIRSTGGIGASLYAGGATASTNSGTIAGATTGVALLGGRLTNSGTITGGTTGVTLSGATLVNAAGGQISGGTLAIASSGSSGGIVNAGTIAGSVDLTLPFFYDYGDDLFVDDGGSVAGAIRLGGGNDELVVTLGGDPARPLAGATGGVDAGDGYDTLRTRVTADGSATLALTGGFEALAYELSNDAALTLTAPQPIATSIGLAGNGSVTLNGAISTADRTLVDATILTVAQLTEGLAGPARDLAIVNNGNLALTVGSQNFAYNLAAILGDTADLTNNGTISVINTPGSYYAGGAVFTGDSLANAGTITLTGGGTAVDSVRAVTNSGRITAFGTTSGANASTAMGVANVTTLTNTGTIRSDGTAVQSGFGNSTITNSGTIESTRGTAIVGGYTGTIVNEAGGTIRGVTAVQLGGGALINRGTIVGDVAAYAYSYAPAVYIADGGTLSGNLTFGSGQDTFAAFGETTGVSGTVDGGAGIDTLIQARRTSGTVTLGALAVTNFEVEGVRALGSDTVVTIAAPAPFARDLALSGDGTIVNTAAITGAVLAYPTYGSDPTVVGLTTPIALENQGTIDGGVEGRVRSLINTGTIGSASLTGQAVNLDTIDTLAFDNGGTIANDREQTAVVLQGYGASAITAGNSGTIDGGVSVGLQQYQSFPPAGTPASLTASLTNSGTIINGESAVAIAVDVSNGVTGKATLANSGTITATGEAALGAYIQLYGYSGAAGSGTIDVANTGTISANSGGTVGSFTFPDGETISFTDPAAALWLSGRNAAGVTASVANDGTIEATGTRSVALIALDAALDLTNTGTIRGGAGTILAADDQLGALAGAPYLAGAVQTTGTGSDRIVNTGTIIGSIALGAGDDRIENSGRIAGDVFLGLGDDTFVQRASAGLEGRVDAGLGSDSLVVDATGGGAVNGDQFVNFERFAQIGEGNVAYSGNFRFDTIGVMGGTITVAAGQTLSSAGAITVTGSDADETLDNRGTITGGVDLAGGNDRVDNRGTIGGAVLLGSGNDLFVDYAGSSAGAVDGGTGSDLYRVVLAGDRSGIGQRSGFEQLAVEGNGMLSLALDQSFEQIALAGSGLTLALGGFTVGQVTGSDARETLAVDGDPAAVSLGGGDDTLALGAGRAGGSYAGGAGSDTLAFTASGPVLLAGTATGFEQVSLAGGALTIAGTLGSNGAGLAFGDGAQALTVAPGGTLAGAIDLGAGDDSLRLAAGGILAGTVAGGAGTDNATLELAGDRTLASGTLTGFELLTTEGSGTLTLAGTQGYQRITAGTDLTIGADAALTADQIQFGTRDDRLTIAGGFAGSVDGAAGNDTIAVSAGSATAPVAFAGIANVERYAQSGGFATLSGTAALGTVDISGGGLVGLAGSTLTANQVTVARGATFGSAGNVTGNLAVAGTLSPGATGVGTMSVTGNVALGAGSLSLFEVAPTGADRLQVTGAVTIASGATLQLAPLGTIRPGTSYDLVVASGGITGSYTTVVKPDSLFGFVVQRADRIQLLGQFLGGAGFTPQVARSIAYANTTLQAQPATSTLFAALPALLNADGTSNARAFAQLTPEPYASVTQAGLDNALTLAGAARGPAFATLREDPGLFTFGQGVGQWHTLGADQAEGTAKARTRGYGFLGGIGYGDTSFAVGAFAGYLDTRQTIGALGAETKSDGFVAGVHARYAANGIGLTASVLYDGGEARTTRALPGTARAIGSYDLHSWVADLSVSYALDMGTEWSLRPRAGVTYLRTTRDGVTETGGAFALNVARDRHVAGFVDGGVMLARSDASSAPLRPFVALGARYQIEGRRTDALASYAGGPLGLTAIGAARARLVGTASAGISYRMTGGLDLFSTASAQTGRDDHQETISTGLRLRF